MGFNFNALLTHLGLKCGGGALHLFLCEMWESDQVIGSQLEKKKSNDNNTPIITNVFFFG